MKKAFLIPFAILLLFACKNDSSNTNTESEESTAQTQQTESEQVTVEGRMGYIVDWIWWYTGYVSTRQDYRKEQRGKWFQFKADGTFDFGKFQDMTGTGNWTYEESTEKLFMTFPPNNFRMEWKTMMSHTNDLMVWMGPPTGVNKGDQARLAKFLQRPTEADVAQ